MNFEIVRVDLRARLKIGGDSIVLYKNGFEELYLPFVTQR